MTERENCWSKHRVTRPSTDQPSYGIFDAKKGEKQDHAISDVLPLQAIAGLQKWACRRPGPEILPEMLGKNYFVRCPIAARFGCLKPDFFAEIRFCKVCIL